MGDTLKVCEACAKKMGALLHVPVIREMVPGNCYKCERPAMLFVINLHSTTESELMAEGFSKYEAEEIMARIECGESIDSAIQAVVC